MYKKQFKEAKDHKDHKHDKKEDEEEVKPINMKDIKLPEEYDGAAGAFMEWHSRLKTLLVNRNPSWETILTLIESRGEKRIKGIEDVLQELVEKGHDTLGDIVDKYATQMLTYFNSYTKGSTHTKVLKGNISEVFDIY